MGAVALRCTSPQFRLPYGSGGDGRAGREEAGRGGEEAPVGDPIRIDARFALDPDSHRFMCVGLCVYVLCQSLRIGSRAKYEKWVNIKLLAGKGY